METVEKTELAILSDIGRISNAPAPLPQKLQRIVEAVSRGMGRDGASIFLLDRGGATVTLSAAVGLNQESVGRLSFPLGMGIAGWVAQQKVPLALEDPYADPRFQYAPESGIDRFRSCIAAPILDADSCLGVIFVLSATPWAASPSDITLLTTTANQVSGVIQSSRLFQGVQQRLSQLSTIYEITMALTTTLNLEQILSLVAWNVTQVVHAQGCAIRLLDLPKTQAAHGVDPTHLSSDDIRPVDARIGEAVTRRTAAERRPLLIPNAAADPLFAGIADLPPVSLISVPFVFHDRVIGVITLYNRQNGQPFDEDDLQFVNTISGSAAVAIVNAALYERMEELATDSRMRAEEMKILYDINTAMSTTLNLDRLLRIILTAATMGGSGLGFNRALLLLTNERARVLQGMMGVGPSTWEEAGQAWSEASARHKSLMEWIQTGDLFETRDTPFNTAARSIRVPLDPKDGVLALTVLEKKPFNVTDAAASSLVGAELRDLLKVNAFATVPLVTKDKAIGVILVDNLFTQRPITDRDLRFLTMFANQAALAVENAIIYSNLENLNREMRSMQQQLVQSEKMAVLGAMMAEITHEIRNPLVSIGGFTRRLARKVQDPDASRYIGIILSEVERLESVVQDNLAFIRENVPHFVEADINTVIEEMLALYEDEFRQRGITLEKSFSPAVPKLAIDPPQIKQAVINVMTNAMEAMNAGGVLTVRTYSVPDMAEAAVEISDTGPGIPGDALFTIFNPYYTTKERGTGLGLPITKRIITAHHGAIEVRNRDGGGAVFTLKLPYPIRGNSDGAPSTGDGGSL
jgi:signal transduction histidine kinase